MSSTIDHFTRKDVLRIVGITPSQLGYWERLQLVQPHTQWHKKIYTFRDLVSLRAVKQLREQRVPVGLVRQAVDAVRRQLRQTEIPVTELRIKSNGSKVSVEYQGVTIEPISGQLLINFDSPTAGAAWKKVSAMRRRSFEEWFALALEYEKCSDQRPQAIEAYRRVLEKVPSSVEARINLGTLLYEQGDLAGSAEHFHYAVALRPECSVGHFNLGTVLEDLGELDAAARHLRRAVDLQPDYADAHYNLARLCEKLNAYREAREHWRRYLQLDPNSSWAQYARQRLGTDAGSPKDFGSPAPS